MSDEAVIVKGNGSLFLAGPPLVKVTPSTWSVVSLLYILTSHPAFCLIIKQKYCLSHQKIGKSLFFVHHAIHFEWTHSIFNQNYSTNLTHFSKTVAKPKVTYRKVCFIQRVFFH